MDLLIKHRNKIRIVPEGKWYCNAYAGSDRDPEYYERKSYEGRMLVKVYAKIVDNILKLPFNWSHKYNEATQKYEKCFNVPLEFIEFLNAKEILVEEEILENDS